MDLTFIKLIVDLVLPYRNGRHVPHAAGDVISIADLSPALAKRLNDPLFVGVLEAS